MQYIFIVFAFINLTRSTSLGTTDSEASSGSLSERSSSELSLLEAEMIAVSGSAGIGRCNATDLAIWKQNSVFIDKHRECARKKFGDGPKTAACISNLYPSLTHTCATCFGDVTQCMRGGCWAQCLFDDTSGSCQSCFDDKCQDPFHTCLGRDLLAMDVLNIPLRPGVLPEGALAMTSIAPTVALRTRRRVVETVTITTTTSPYFSGSAAVSSSE